ncbi:hypothetical protein BGW38_009759 [Lunasporangiospora selenospora]|uniref:Uncharacterized protein n=1 Tax=Lunasporangiospora selenospora TaxID=979761 RepID=A0A9P6FXA1_9FUNG|nr:hypothetical protein BGW38_009759 [Lunasporangiospora selenospora]
MTSRYPPQSRMPTLVPQNTQKLWYPTQRGVEHMNLQLMEEEMAYENTDPEVERYDEEEEEEDVDGEEHDEGVAIEGEITMQEEMDQYDLDDGISVATGDLYDNEHHDHGEDDLDLSVDLGAVGSIAMDADLDLMEASDMVEDSLDLQEAQARGPILSFDMDPDSPSYQLYSEGRDLDADIEDAQPTFYGSDDDISQ